jgi:hypothetical protein
MKLRRLTHSLFFYRNYEASARSAPENSENILMTGIGEGIIYGVICPIALRETVFHACELMRKISNVIHILCSQLHASFPSGFYNTLIL